MNLDVVLIAEICHEANRAYCIRLGDLTQPAWEVAPDWQRTSAINGVKAHLADTSMTPERSHQGWLAEKAAAGWTWGPVKDPEKREHPCFKSYHELPADQRMKDHIFNAICRGLLPLIAPTTVEEAAA